MYVPTTQATQGLSPINKPIAMMPRPTHQQLHPLRSQKIGLRLPLLAMRQRRQREQEAEVEQLLRRRRRLEEAHQVTRRAQQSRRVAIRAAGLGRGLWVLTE